MIIIELDEILGYIEKAKTSSEYVRKKFFVDMKQGIEGLWQTYKTTGKEKHKQLVVLIKNGLKISMKKRKEVSFEQLCAIKYALELTKREVLVETDLKGVDKKFRDLNIYTIPSIPRMSKLID